MAQHSPEGGPENASTSTALAATAEGRQEPVTRGRRHNAVAGSRECESSAVLASITPAVAEPPCSSFAVG